MENAIERVVLLYDGPNVTVDQLSFLEGERSDTATSSGESAFVIGGGVKGLIPAGGIDLDDLIMQLVEEAMDMSGGNKAKAAKLLNISPRTISRRLEKLGGEE